MEEDGAGRGAERRRATGWLQIEGDLRGERVGEQQYKVIGDEIVFKLRQRVGSPSRSAYQCLGSLRLSLHAWYERTSRARPILCRQEKNLSLGTHLGVMLA